MKQQKKNKALLFGGIALGVLILGVGAATLPWLGSASLLPSHGRRIWPRDVLKKVSRGLSRVEAGHPGVPRLVQVTSGGFSWWL